ncbi:MAG TPA: hypothetical protein PLN21_02905 [Gemmatales bacterium]|nr:hypothetical protein [Gemmatales bacterium]
MRRSTRWVSITLASLLVGLLLGCIVAGFLYYGRGVTKYLSSGESSYQAGLVAVRDNRLEKAIVYFHEAILSAENLLQEFEEPESEPKPQEQFEKEQRYIGQAYWIKHRAVKARGFTKQLVDNKPLPTFEGQEEGTSDQVIQKLSALRLPDEESRREAVSCLREAAYRLPGNVEVLREAVAAEIQFDPMQWNHVHAFATTLAELDPNDERALYLLARLEYEQPIAVKGDSGKATLPMPMAKRSKDRMMKGLEFVSKLKAKETRLRWRTVCLEGQMNSWLIQNYRQPGQLKPDAEREANVRLRALLFDAEQGAINMAQKQASLEGISRLDLQGLYQLHQMALDLSIEDARRAGRNTELAEAQQPYLEQMQRIMDACLFLATKTKKNRRATEAAEFLTQACLKTMSCMIAQRPEIWSSYRDQVIELGKLARLEDRIGQTLPLRMADLLSRDGQWQEQRLAVESAKMRYADAVQWLDDGLKAADVSKVITQAVLNMHEAKLRLLNRQEAPLSTYQPHLDALTFSKQESALAAAAYYEGTLAERAGRLQFARGQLERATRSSRNDLARKALTKLIPIYLTLEMPDQALTAIRDLTRIIALQDAFNPEEQSRTNGMVRKPDDLLVQRMQAHLLAANQAQYLIKTDAGLARQQQSALVHHEAQVKQLIEQGSKNPVIAGRIQVAWAQYLMQWDRLKEAEPLVTSLGIEHAEWLDTLRLQIGLVLHQSQPDEAQPGSTTPPEVQKKVDELIEQYLARTQAQPGGKLIWLKWLATTGRVEMMQKLIDDKVFLGDASNDVVARRLRALAYLYVSQREQKNEMLKILPVNPQIEVALLQTAHSLSEQPNAPVSSLEQQQDSGLFRTWSAAIALAKGDHAEACRQFANCLEYSRVRPLVRQGLLEALIAWSDQQPAEARKFAAELLQQYTSDLSLLLGYAYASMRIGEIGNPTDAGDQVKDMATALKAFEAACVQEHRDPAYAAWVEAQCWRISPRRDLALFHVLRTLELNPRHEAAYVLAINMLLDKNDNTGIEQAQQLASAYRTNLPQSKEALYWQARCHDQIGRANDALALYRELMEKMPRHPGVYPATCQLLLTSTSVESLAACQQVINRWKAALPEDVRATQMEVQLLASQNKLADSRAEADRTLSSIESKIMGDSPIQTVSTEKQQQLAVRKADTLSLLAQALVQSKQASEASIWVKRALELYPDHEGAQMLLGDMLVDQMRSQPARSETRRGLAQQAAASYSKVYRRQQGQMVSGNKLATLLATELNDPTEAYRIMQEVRAAKFYTRPMTGDMLPIEMLDTLGIVYSKLAQTDLVQERIQTFEAARRRYAEEPRVALYLAQAYLAAGDGKSAMVTYQAARSLLPKSSLPADVQRTMTQEIQQGMVEAQDKSN